MIFNNLQRGKKWNDWKLQIKNSITSIEQFEEVSGIQFSDMERTEFQKTIENFPLSITPYYASLISKKNYLNDPIFKQSFPSTKEMNIVSGDLLDPLSEDADSPIEGVTHRYPDRVLLHVSNRCAMYCRHCTRKRKVGDTSRIPSKKRIARGIEYIRNNPEVRDVLLSGGDPFMLSDAYIDWILSEVKSIPHVEVVRIGTRIPVVLPFRVTDSLIRILQKHKPLWINTHFNHPREISLEASQALAKLADAGIPLGNQSVLLAGVNDCIHIMKSLVRKLVLNRVRPYYLYQCDLSAGLSHFRTPISKGIEIIEGLRGHTSGFSVPTFVVDAPGGGGKIPLMPQYMLSASPNKVVLRNFEGVITTYAEPANYDNKFCDLDCRKCGLHLHMETQEETPPVGIKKLLADFDDAISLIPQGTERIGKRKSEDEILQLGTAVIQHGKNNDRVYLMKLGEENPSRIVSQIEALAVANEYTKMFVKIPERAKGVFEKNGYGTEAYIPALYGGHEGGYFMARYFDKKRAVIDNQERIEEILRHCTLKSIAPPKVHTLPNSCILTKATRENAASIAELYRSVFESYPFPIDEESYVQRTLDADSEYFCIWREAELVASSCMEKDMSAHHVEMTDFAVRPDMQGNGFSKILLRAMENAATEQGIKTAFTIARACSWGMNVCFSRSGYAFAGLLKNNTDIDGSLESMNVWHKALA